MSLAVFNLVLALLAVNLCPLSSPLTDEHAYQQALQACPNDPKTYQEFAGFLIAKGKFSMAKAVAESGLKISPADPTLLLEHGAALLSLGNAEKALAELNTIPPTAKSQFYVGLANRQLGNHPASQKALSDAWELGYQMPICCTPSSKKIATPATNPLACGIFSSFSKPFPIPPGCTFSWETPTSIKNATRKPVKNTNRPSHASPI